MPTTRTQLTFADNKSNAQPQAMSLDESLASLSIVPESARKFHLFPSFPIEIRLQIWSHAILALPERVIPIHEITGKKCTPAYFTTSRPHTLFAVINREAREAVFNTLQRLFLPAGGHDFVSVNFEKDIILLCSDNGHLRPKTLKRLQKAMGPRTKEDHLHLAAQVQIEQRGNYYIPNPECDVIASMTEIFPEICHFTLVPVEFVDSDGAENYRGELCLGNKKGFEGRIKDYYTHVNKEEYQHRRPSYWLLGEQKRQMMMGPEIRWGCLQFVGGEKFRDWDRATKGFWRLKREGDEEPKIIILPPRRG
jgi:2EXR family